MTGKIAFLGGWSWFKFNNSGLALGTNLKFCTSVAKGFKLKVWKFWGPNPTFVEVTGENPPPSWTGLRVFRPLGLFTMCHHTTKFSSLGTSICSFISSESVVQRCSVKKSVLTNFTKFKGKHLCQRLFLNKAGLQEILAQVFSYEFCEIFKSNFFTEHFQWLFFSDI